MKILTAAEMQAADRSTFTGFALPSRAVMEAAGQATFHLLLRKFSANIDRGVLVLAGGGNNAGDGYVLARLLQNKRLPVRVLATTPPAALREDCLANFQSATQAGVAIDFVNESNWREQLNSSVSAAGVLVDALFGTGFHGSLDGWLGEFVSEMNRLATHQALSVLAVDIPSGVDGSSGAVLGPAVKADATLTFQCLKAGLVLFPGAELAGEVIVADIGISELSSEFSAVRSTLIAAAHVRGLLAKLPLQQNVHKGSRGHVLVVGGGAGHYGAAELSARSALKSGAGLVSLLLPQSGLAQLPKDFPELMVSGLAEEDGNFSATAVPSLAEAILKKKSLLVGPGLGTSSGALAVLRASLSLAKQADIATVLDADALNLLALHPDLRETLPTRLVLTPHPGEMARLLGKSVEEVESFRLDAAQMASEKFTAAVVLKGARTVVATANGELWINPAATAVLATAGSGDVLAGCVSALLALGLQEKEAATSAVFLHGLAGELLESRFGSAFGVSASNILAELPAAFLAVSSEVLGSPAALQRVLPGSFWKAY